MIPDTHRVVLLVDRTRRVGQEILRGIAKYSHLYGPWTFYTQPPAYIKFPRQKEFMRGLKEWCPNGIIVRDSFWELDQILALGIPAIVVSGTKEAFPGVPGMIDDYQTTGRMAARHFLDRGFKNFAYCGFDDLPWSQGRCASFAKYVADAGFEISVYKQPKSQKARLWEKEPVFIAQWLKSLPTPLAVMTCADHRSQQVIEACKIAALRVPEQVAVLGVDNDELVCELSGLPLSSVALDFEGAGYEAAQLLDSMMSGEKTAVKQIILRPTHIVTRQSTDILAIDDVDVANAVRFIRNHARDMIQVNDVVHAAAISRRNLYYKFKRYLERSISSEIRRVRVQEIAAILLNTEMTVSQIAAKLGYCGADHISRYFKQEMKMSPLEYRRTYGTQAATKSGLL